jgi:hypothetical protein
MKKFILFTVVVSFLATGLFSAAVPVPLSPVGEKFERSFFQQEEVACEPRSAELLHGERLQLAGEIERLRQEISRLGGHPGITASIVIKNRECYRILCEYHERNPLDIFDGKKCGDSITVEQSLLNAYRERAKSLLLNGDKGGQEELHLFVQRREEGRAYCWDKVLCELVRVAIKMGIFDGRVEMAREDQRPALLVRMASFENEIISLSGRLHRYKVALDRGDILVLEEGLRWVSLFSNWIEHGAAGKAFGALVFEADSRYNLIKIDVKSCYKDWVRDINEGRKRRSLSRSCGEGSMDFDFPAPLSPEEVLFKTFRG